MKQEEITGFTYQASFKLPSAYIKYKEPVYDGYESFSFNQMDYEIKERDIRFLEQSGLEITEQDFDKIIDTFEKIVARD